MLEEKFRAWCREVKSLESPSISTRISLCRRVEQAKSINLDEVFIFPEKWEILLSEFRNYTSNDWQCGVRPAHGVPFSENANWYAGTKNILSALKFYADFKQYTNKHPDADFNGDKSVEIISMDACPRAVHQEIMDVEAESDNPRMLVADLIRNAYNQLNPRERAVINERYGLSDGKPRTLDEIAAKYNVPRGRILQIEAKALRKLRHPSRINRIPTTPPGTEGNQKNDKT